MTWRGAAGGVTLVDDYAHHPTEIRVTLEAAKRRYEPKRTWVVFQPHQAARTRHLMDGFAEALTVVDETIVLDAFGAREQAEDDEGRGEVSSSEKLAQRIRRNGGEAQYMQDSGMAARHVVQNVLPGDLVITMGAGDVWKVADELVEQICRPH
jgi:UDP-N-acetylmuramate--alanine ligase